MIRRHATALRLLLMGADALSAFGLFVATSMIRFGDAWLVTWRSAGIDALAAATVYAVTWVTLLWILGLYRLRARWTARIEVQDVGRAAVLLGLITFSALFAFKLPDVSRLFLLSLFVGQVVLTVVSRGMVRALLHALRDRGHNLRYMLVVGTGKDARRFADRVERHRELGLRVIGHLAVHGSPRLAGKRPVLGSMDDIETVLHDRIVDEVAVCLPAEDLHWVEPVARLCEEVGKIVRIPLDDVPVSLPGGRVEDFDGGKVLSLVYGPDRAVGLVAKRLIDVALAALAMILLLPVFAIVGLLIYLSDGRPVIFRQTRVGLHGRPFEVVKFRTMVRDAEALIDGARRPERDQGPCVQDHRRPTPDPDRRHPAGDQPRRAAAGVECPARPNEPRGTATAVAARGGGLRPVAPTTAVDEAWDHRALAGRGPARRRLRPLGRARPRLYRSVVDLA